MFGFDLIQKFLSFRFAFGDYSSVLRGKWGMDLHVIIGGRVSRILRKTWSRQLFVALCRKITISHTWESYEFCLNVRKPNKPITKRKITVIKYTINLNQYNFKKRIYWLLLHETSFSFCTTFLNIENNQNIVSNQFMATMVWFIIIKTVCMYTHLMNYHHRQWTCARVKNARKRYQSVE